jgi:hypothetical protein
MSWQSIQAFTVSNVEKIPKGKAGVYAIWGDKTAQPLYYGMSSGTPKSCIRERLKDHVTGKGNIGIAEALRTGSEGRMAFSYIETRDYAFVEAALIRGGLPQFNIAQPRRPLKID